MSKPSETEQDILKAAESKFRKAREDHFSEDPTVTTTGLERVAMNYILLRLACETLTPGQREELEGHLEYLTSHPSQPQS